MGYPFAQRELDWASGFFEGEGCILRAEKDKRTLRLILVNTDFDAIVRFRNAIGQLGDIDVRLPKQVHHKLAFEWKVQRFEYVQAVLGLLWFGLSERRREKAKELLRHYVDNSTSKKLTPKQKGVY